MQEVNSKGSEQEWHPFLSSLIRKLSQQCVVLAVDRNCHLDIRNENINQLFLMRERARERHKRERRESQSYGIHILGNNIILPLLSVSSSSLSDE